MPVYLMIRPRVKTSSAAQNEHGILYTFTVIVGLRLHEGSSAAVPVRWSLQCHCLPGRGYEGSGETLSYCTAPSKSLLADAAGITDSKQL